MAKNSSLLSMLLWVCLIVGLVLPSLTLAISKRDDAEEADGSDPWGKDGDNAHAALFDEDDETADRFDFDESDLEYLQTIEEDATTGRMTAGQILEQLKARKERQQPRAAADGQQAASDAAAREGVVALTAESFDEALQRFPYAFVEFYAPWCGHCKKLAPELEAAARELAGQPGVLIAKVDCTVEEALGRRFDVRGYPTMKFFRNGKYLTDYELGRTAADVVAFIKKKSVPTTVVLNTAQEVKDFLDAHPTALIVYAESNSDALLGVRDAADQAVVEGFAFGEVSSPDLIKQLGQQADTVKIYRSFAPDEPHVLLNPTPASVLGAVLAHGFPYVDDGPQAWDRVMSRKVPIVILFVDMEVEGVQDVLAWFTELAKANINRFSFIYAGKEFHSRLPALGASGDVIPTIVVVDAETTKSWPYDETKELNRENVEAMLHGIVDGILRSHYTSEKPPLDNSGDVLVVVGDTFEELVLNNDKDVLVEFYAPWCGHCKQLAPTWEKVGQHFAKQQDKVIVAKIDASANDNPAVVVPAYPMIYLFAAGDKANPIEYKGLTRHVDDFIKFVEENATSFKGESGSDHDDASESYEDDHHAHDHDDL